MNVNLAFKIMFWKIDKEKTAFWLIKLTAKNLQDSK